MNNDVIQQIIELTKSDNKEISGTASTALSLFYQHTDNKISDDEFSELMSDIIKLDKVQQMNDEIEYYRILIKSVNTLLTLKSLASLI